jgi:Fic family protein
LGRLVKQSWTSSIAGIGIPRRDAAGGRYFAYVPEDLTEQPLSLDGDVAADVEDAAISIARLDRRAVALTNTEALARLLLRAESVASSRIEGLVISPQRLLRADSEIAEGLAVSDRAAVDVLANVRAMEYAVAGSGEVTIDRLLEVHRRLLETSRSPEIAGVLREKQNWIGGSIYNPIGADFVPPPPSEVPRLLEDLCAFCNQDRLPAVAQAAIAHARFETIHPFADGNGRTGRALTYMVLRRRRLSIRATPPISLVLATRSKEYVARLNATRYEGRPSSPQAHEAINAWIAFFAAACVSAVAQAEEFEDRVSAIQAQWRERLAHERAGSTALALVDWLPAAPILSVKSAASITKRTYAAANNAIDKLVAAKILSPIKTAKRNRTFEARQLVDAFAKLERQLASPQSDTRVAKPARPVPAKPARR